MNSKRRRFRVPKLEWQQIVDMFPEESVDSIVCTVINHIYYSFSFGHEELLKKLPDDAECCTITVELPAVVVQKLKNAAKFGAKPSDVLFSGIRLLLE